MKDLRVMKNDELKDVAREYCITGTWKMNKNQLIDCIIRNAELNGHTDKYFDSAPEEPRDAPELTEAAESNKLLNKTKEPTEEPRDASKPKLKKYAASVRDRKTKELKDIFGEAKSRYEFYLSIKDEYRVRFIVTPDKLEEAYEKYRVGHARNLMLKKEKYSHDKAEAEKMKMTVAEYRKWLREPAKTVK